MESFLAVLEVGDSDGAVVVSRAGFGSTAAWATRFGAGATHRRAGFRRGEGAEEGTALYGSASKVALRVSRGPGRRERCLGVVLVVLLKTGIGRR